MQDVSHSPGKAKSTARRSRLYFRLMDICLFFLVVGLIDWIASHYDVENAPAWYLAGGLVMIIFNSFVPLFLMVASFMRDDYAEGLVKRSLRVMAYGAALIPPFLLIGPWVLGGIFVNTDLRAPDFYREFYNAFYLSEMRPELVLRRVWFLYMLSFVGIFQFLRWKDSR